MKTWAVSQEAGIIVEAESVEELEDGRLIFYIGEEPVFAFPPDAWFDYQEVD